MQILLSDPLWWQWMAFGFILVVAEIIVPSFVVIWFGIAAIIVSIIDLIFDTGFKTELFLWIFISSFLLFLWFKVYKPKTLTKSGQADEDMHTKGIITQEVEPFGRGRAKFEVPILGSSDWVVTSDERLDVGTHIISIEALGNMLKVKKIK